VWLVIQVYLIKRFTSAGPHPNAARTLLSAHGFPFCALQVVPTPRHTHIGNLVPLDDEGGAWV